MEPLAAEVSTIRLLAVLLCVLCHLVSWRGETMPGWNCALFSSTQSVYDRIMGRFLNQCLLASVRDIGTGAVPQNFQEFKVKVQRFETGWLYLLYSWPVPLLHASCALHAWIRRRGGRYSTGQLSQVTNGPRKRPAYGHRAAYINSYICKTAVR